MVTGHETIETIHDINWKNFTATPSGSNAGRESRGGADFRRQRDQRPLIPKFSAPKNLQRPGRDAPLRVAPLLGNSQSGFPSCSLLPLTVSDDAGDSSMLGSNSFALHIESLTNT
jgi:hypothetical protein